MAWDLARKGWILKSMYACFATFEESEPKELRYRIVPNAAFKAEDEEIAFYEENGFTYSNDDLTLDIRYLSAKLNSVVFGTMLNFNQ